MKATKKNCLTKNQEKVMLKTYGDLATATQNQYKGEEIIVNITIKGGQKYYDKEYVPRRVWHNTQGKPQSVLLKFKATLKTPQPKKGIKYYFQLIQKANGPAPTNGNVTAYQSRVPPNLPSP